MVDDFEQCYRAILSRDRRFDGRFVTAVTSTGIYCRPSCPAQTPKRENVRFFRVPAAAQAAGFRACKRCRPDVSPGSPDWDVRADLTARALRLIADGVVDVSGVSGLAQRLAVSERHLYRQLVAEVGAGPLALARTRRAQTARLLVESTPMQLTDVAYAAGYGSIRQFNDAFREAFGSTPSQAREKAAKSIALSGNGAIVLRLAYRPPYHAAGVLDWLGTRAIPGLEEVEGATYRRALQLPRSVAVAEIVAPDDGFGAASCADGAKRSRSAHPMPWSAGGAGATHTNGAVTMRLTTEDLRDLTPAVQRCRQLFDLDADPAQISETLAADPMLAPLVAARPGVRVPGAVDGFELACRAVLGQQVTVAGARTLAARMVAAYGKPLVAASGSLTHLFPTAESIAASSPEELGTLGLTRARAATLHALGVEVATGRLELDRGADRVATARALGAIPGIGPWTVGYVAMRALGDPDAMPAADLGLRKASAALGGPESAKDLAARAAAWRPWRSYGAMHLWTSLSDKEAR